MTLSEAIRSPGFSPRKADADKLFELLTAEDKRQSLAAERALARLGDFAAAEAMARLPQAGPPARARLCRLVGRVAQQTKDPELGRFLCQQLSDADSKTRRNAIICLGKLRLPEIEPALLAVWDAQPSLELRRSLAASLGKAGGLAALQRLLEATTDDPELKRIIHEARLKIERTHKRRERGRINAHASAPAPLPVVFRCRRGLEQILAEEIDHELSPRVAGLGRVKAVLEGPMDRLRRPRTMLRFGFALAPERVQGREDLAETAARALTSPAALQILRTWTLGRVRYRLEWESAGHRRSTTWRCASEVASRAPDLLNDPTESGWEAVIAEKKNKRGRLLEIDLWPRGLRDKRFAYRQRDIPASSHPTIAAALARLGEVRPDDVVWDPFCGSGTELVERGLLGPCRTLYGSDSDPQAIEAARENLQASGVGRWELAIADARRALPAESPSLILTNPPMGRRVLPGEPLQALYRACVARFAELLIPSGRLVWISPLSELSLAEARRAGLKVGFRREVDMGGFTAEIQVLNKPG